MIEQRFIGITLAPAGHIAHAVCLDDRGRSTDQITFAWTPEKLRHALDRLAARPAEISVGLELDPVEPAIERTLRQADLPTKRIDRRQVEALFGLFRHRKRILAQRARLVAQILWLAEYRPEVLIEGI